ncbi:MAG: hypothetical protein JST96_15990, partial [Bacteroidetes bacterium]|nr:hypothetical protein [Bacteroidota bacterium]
MSRNQMQSGISPKKIFSFFIFCTTILLHNSIAFAQKTSSEKKEIKSHHKKVVQRHSADSVWEKDLKISDTSAARTIGKIENINNTLNDYNDVVDDGYDSSDITENLPDYERKLKFYQVFLNNTNTNLNLSRLSYMQGSLDDMVDDLKDWQKSLLDYYTVLVGMNTQMHSILADSAMQDLPADSTLRLLYLRQFNELKKRLRTTDTVMKKNILKIDLLQSKVSNDYVTVIGLQKQIKGLVKTYRKKAFTKEAGYLWEGPSGDTTAATKTIGYILQRSINRNNRQLSSYLSENMDKYIFNIPIFLIFFFWVLVNVRKVKKSNPGFLATLKYIKPFPLLASLAVMLVVAPYLDLQHPPAVYLILLQLLLIIVLTFLLFRKWPRKLFYSWLLFFVLFVFFAGKSLMSTSTYNLRLLTFFTTVVSAFAGWRFIRAINNYPGVFPRYFKFITGIYIFLNVLAACCNLYGRATLAHIFESTAIMNYIEAICLIIFIQVFLDAVNLQLEADKKSTRFTAYLNYQNVELRLRRLLTVIAAIFWFINLAQNLNIFDAAYDFISDFLDAERTVGNSSFTLASILIFFLVIWLANFCQKYIGYFFGDTGNEEIVP